jgi:hypothetical protein
VIKGRTNKNFIQKSSHVKGCVRNLDLYELVEQRERIKERVQFSKTLNVGTNHSSSRFYKTKAAVEIHGYVERGNGT